MTGAVLRNQVWEHVCRHVDGLSVGTTVHALHERGVLALLAEGRPVDVADLARDFSANPGYLHVALGLLANQGWLTARAPGPAVETLTCTATPQGKAVLSGLALHYATATAFLPLARRLGHVLFGEYDPDGEKEFATALDLMREEWQVPARARPVSARLTVLAHLDGHLAGPVMAHLAKHGMLERPEGVTFTGGGPANPGALRTACDILAHQGWAVVDEEGARLTPHGVVAAACARQYWHPVSYLPLLGSVDELLFGDPASARTAPDEDAHLDRELDIVFSGDVFSATCEEPFLEICLPLFDTADPGSQPALVVDSGCGDGTLLHALYTAVRERTERGRRLAEHPLLMVGVEPSAVARRITAERLAAAGIPHLVVDGDITDPDAMARSLAAHGLDAGDALHVSKSVIHDRDYLARAARPVPDGEIPPRMLRFFATPDGQAITPDAMAHDLTAHFADWRSVADRHGLVVIEAHAVDAARSAELVGRTMATDLDATHGYSHQYPVEPQVFAWAAKMAGFHSRAHRDLGVSQVGHTMLTIDHFTTRRER
ncbi:hypothetical protein CTZ27_21040 [Streptomyces griseocarneus]|nr:hypothetical protein CTZ27_21040 [Streptomyces griseocarneus]